MLLIPPCQLHIGTALTLSLSHLLAGIFLTIVWRQGSEGPSRPRSVGPSEVPHSGTHVPSHLSNLSLRKEPHADPLTRDLDEEDASDIILKR